MGEQVNERILAPLQVGCIWLSNGGRFIGSQQGYHGGMIGQREQIDGQAEQERSGDRLIRRAAQTGAIHNQLIDGVRIVGAITEQHLATRNQSR